jgi:hypothetical protein
VNRRPAVIACIVLGVVSLGVAVYYIADGHTKRAIAGVVLAVAFGIGAWLLNRQSDRA